MTNPFHQHDTDDHEYVGTFSYEDRARDVWCTNPDGEEEDEIIIRSSDREDDYRCMSVSAVTAICRSGGSELYCRALSLYEAFQNGRKSL